MTWPTGVIFNDVFFNILIWRFEVHIGLTAKLHSRRPLGYRKNMREEDIKILLTKDEGLVLFEMLSRYSESEKLNIEHQSEERALWYLQCILEKVIVEPFKPNYSQLLQAARERLKDIEA
jgi:hypothetical protein